PAVLLRRFPPFDEGVRALGRRAVAFGRSDRPRVDAERFGPGLKVHRGALPMREWTASRFCSSRWLKAFSIDCRSARPTETMEPARHEPGLLVTTVSCATGSVCAGSADKRARSPPVSAHGSPELA